MSGTGSKRAFEAASRLVATFRANEAFYRSPSYQEAEARKDFIDKFFIALGWDVNHDIQKNPYEQEVKVERNEGGSQRRADYAFLSSNYRDVRFFVEAKKPYGDIANPDNCFQTIRYGWNSQNSLAVLTSFEQFCILDSRYRPDIELAVSRCLKKYHYTDYENSERFAEIYYLFSREAIANGSLERYSETLPKPQRGAIQRGLFPGRYQRIDDSFLEELDEHRTTLARGFKRQNPTLDSETLTEITQRTIDRLVFLRFLEDKSIEPEYLVAHFGSKGTAWQDFVRASRRLDGIYDGIVFKKHDLLDSPDFNVDDDEFSAICERLAHINSPYDFNAIPIHILGNIYERFLGKVIVATDRRATVEEKPEVRKAGGVYYTPEYIVRYIVDNTVGRLIQSKTPSQIAQMHFVDIACGSGSFLLGVYDLLLRHHTTYYNANPSRTRAGDCVEKEGTLHLSLRKKREILLNNIFGVDIDSQAVEVAQLSLYLKLLESETTASAHHHQMEFHETILPSLQKNVVCGNSIIGTDVLEGELFGSEEEAKLNPMNFEDRFPEILKAGGFDAVVGNPPYVRPHRLSAREKRYFWRHYKGFTHKSDVYCCFIERGTQLLKPGGVFGYIVSNGWLRLNSFQELRKLILEHYRILQLVELPYKVFEEASVNTGILVLQKDSSEGRLSTRVDIVQGRLTDQGGVFSREKQIPQKTFLKTFQNVFDVSISPETEQIKEKMRRGPRIGSLYHICFGLKTADDKKFIHTQRGLHREDKRLLRGEDIKRYAYNWKGEYVWYVPKRMRAHRSTARPGEPDRFEQPKVLVKDTSIDFSGTFDSEEFYVKDVLIIIPKPGSEAPFDLKFLTGLVNSRALHFYYRTTFRTLHVQREELGSLPLPRLTGRAEDRKGHDELVKLVEQTLATKRDLAKATTDKKKAYYESKGQTLDRKIDELVYSLYGLTPEEVSTIESTRVAGPAEGDVIHSERAMEGISPKDGKGDTPDRTARPRGVESGYV